MGYICTGIGHYTYDSILSVFHYVHELLFNREFSSRGGSSRGGLSRGGGEFDRGQPLDDSYRGKQERAATV